MTLEPCCGWCGLPHKLCTSKDKMIYTMVGKCPSFRPIKDFSPSFKQNLISKYKLKVGDED